MLPEVSLQDARKHRHAILVALAAADHDLARGEIDVLDPEPAAFEDAKPGAVEEPGHETGRAVEPLEHRTHFVARQDHRQALGPPGAHDPVEPGQVDL